MNSFLPAAVIFDMDGVLVDTNSFHVQKWEALLTEYGITFDREALPKQVLGPGNDPTLRHFFGDRLTADDRLQLSEELEARFRGAFAPHAKPFPGVERLIAECHEKDVRVALASAAMSKNVFFILDALKLRRCFDVVLTADEITQNKPHPEIYEKTAQKLGILPAACVVIEDSFAGIEAAKGAGMKCVAVASTFPATELRAHTQADLIVNRLEALELENLRGLF
ncbi:MAG: HAD family phosphatase [Terriglobia bacterium]|jgi:beta-phosphoglucomutase family hydrolase